MGLVTASPGPQQRLLQGPLWCCGQSWNPRHPCCCSTLVPHQVQLACWAQVQGLGCPQRKQLPWLAQQQGLRLGGWGALQAASMGSLQQALIDLQGGRGMSSL